MQAKFIPTASQCAHRLQNLHFQTQMKPSLSSRLVNKRLRKESYEKQRIRDKIVQKNTKT